jgi:hypothetical protein
MLLIFLERAAGLAVVQAEWLAMERCGEPTGVAEPQ